MQQVLRKLLVPFTFAMIALGLWQVGGPEQARIEQRDEQRMTDLLALAAFLKCDALPEIEMRNACGPRPIDTDRFTGAPFKITDTTVCASFEQPDRLSHYYQEQLDQGCLRRR